jgi:hypothetical protein
VAQLVEALRYKPKGRGLDSRWCHWNWHNPSGRTMALGSTQSLTEMSTRKISWGRVKCKGGRCVMLTTLPSLCADYLEIWEPPGSLRASLGLYRDSFTFTVQFKRAGFDTECMLDMLGWTCKNQTRSPTWKSMSIMQATGKSLFRHTVDGLYKTASVWCTPSCT